MIPATELRIGNKIRYSLHELTVSQIRNIGGGYVVTKEGIDGYLQEYDGIELTPEILERFGFKRDDWNNGLKKGIVLTYKIKNWVLQYESDYTKTIFILEADGGYDFSGEFDIIERCKYLHQLQNLVFILSGKELEIKL